MVELLGKKIILIVEDNDQLQQVYSDAFLKKGHKVVQVRTAKEALRNIKTVSPNVILLDIMLPGGMNGFDLLEELKRDSVLKKIPVVVLTNLDSENDVAKKIGADEYMVKSDTTIDKVVTLVQKYL